MQPLVNKHIVLGITGSIAAYKSANLVRLLRRAGAEVRVVMTNAACEFITPLTLQTLSGHPVAISLLDADQESAMGHINLSKWLDLLLVAPTSANFIARLTQGKANDLLSALSLTNVSTLALAPAMNNKMWLNKATISNIKLLRSRGIQVLGPVSGDQACGEQGKGRLLEPIDIVSRIEQLVVPKVLVGKQVLVTAGPTFEPIDPVRFIGNRRSGKMGFAVAQAAAEAGAHVVLIAGPVHLVTPTGIRRIDIETAQEMLDSVIAEVYKSDIFISCAAIANYRPTKCANNKIKKMEQNLQIQLELTTDIVAEIAQQDDKPFVVGFAAETQNVESYAKEKLQSKGLDIIAANKIGTGMGISVDHNKLNIFWHNGSHILELTSKAQLAKNLMTLIIERYYAKNTAKNP